MQSTRAAVGAAGQLAMRETLVDGRRARYTVGGTGPPVLFLHGWALGHSAYRRSLRRLVALGVKVLAPAMPGFGGTADLPSDEMSIFGYGHWVDAFLEAVGVTEPALVIGHSFGGGVAIELAHDHPTRVSYLILTNSVGGAQWGRAGRSLTDRPLADWVAGFSRDVASGRDGFDMLLAARDDLVTNVIGNPLGLWRASRLARTADLTSEMALLRERGLPVLALTGESDSVIPHSAFNALCAALGTPGQVVSGGHSWMLTDPDAFATVLGNVVQAEVAKHQDIAATTRTEAIRERLAVITAPDAAVDAMLDGVSPLWLMGDDVATLAADLALAIPPPLEDEVRAVARTIEGSDVIRLTVVARDRPGLLADTAAVLAAERLSIVSASAATWAADGLALHAVTFRPDGAFDDQRWDALAARLRGLTVAGPAQHAFIPTGQADVRVDGADTGRSVVAVTAPDQLGLLATICRWLADHDVSIETMNVATVGAVATDSFIVIGDCDADALARHLSAPEVPGCLPVFRLLAGAQGRPR